MNLIFCHSKKKCKNRWKCPNPKFRVHFHPSKIFFFAKKKIPSVSIYQKPLKKHWAIWFWELLQFSTLPIIYAAWLHTVFHQKLIQDLPSGDCRKSQSRGDITRTEVGNQLWHGSHFAPLSRRSWGNCGPMRGEPGRSGASYCLLMRRYGRLGQRLEEGFNNVCLGHIDLTLPSLSVMTNIQRH